MTNSTWTRFVPDFILKKIEDRLELKQFLGNTGWMLGDKIVSQSVGLFVGVWLARYLGPQLFGDFSYATALVLIFSPFATLGLDGIVIRRLVQDPSCKNEVLGTSFIIMLVGGLVAFALTMASIFIVKPDNNLIYWLVGILASCIIFQAFIAIEFWFESQLQWKFSAFGKTSAFLLLSFVKISLILLEAPLIAFAWAALAETILGSIGLLIVYRLRGYSIRAWLFSHSMAKLLLRDSWPLFFTIFLTMIYLRIDQVMIGKMIGSEELGNYSVAVRISEVWYFIPTIICSSILPAVIRAESVSEELFHAHLQRLYCLMAFISYVVALPVAFFSDTVIQVLFSSAYTEASPILAMLIWAGLFTSLGAARHVFILSKNWTKVNLVSIGLGSVLNILLNFLLIPQYGAMGAAMATVISYWFAVHGTCFLFPPLRKTGWMLTKAIFYPRVWW